MTTVNNTDGRINSSLPNIVRSSETMMDTGLLDKAFPMKSMLVQGLQNIVATDKTAKITEVFRSGMSLRQYSLAEVSEHCDLTSCWIVISDKIYDVTDFVSKHPGGEEIILENAGFDATIPFESKGHSLDAYTVLEKYCIGQLTHDDRRFKTEEKV